MFEWIGEMISERSMLKRFLGIKHPTLKSTARLMDMARSKGEKEGTLNPDGANIVDIILNNRDRIKVSKIKKPEERRR